MRDRQVLDTVHGYVRVPQSLVRVLEHPATQRLRRVSQTALVSMVYPGANGTRFEHALGAMHLAGVATAAAWRNSDEAAKDQLKRSINASVPNVIPADNQGTVATLCDAVSAVGLLHDVGHPPYSHSLEEYFVRAAGSIFDDSPEFLSRLRRDSARPFHEVAGESIVGQMREAFDSDATFNLVNQIYMSDPGGDGWDCALHAIVASVVDIDRLDYIVRDALHAGTEYGAVDSQRLLEALQFKSDGDSVRLSLGLRARSAAELFLVQRMQAYRWMYKHPKVAGLEALLRRALLELESIKSSTYEEELLAALRRSLVACTPTLNFVRPSSQYRISGLSVSALIADDSTRSSSHQQRLFDDVVLGRTTDAAHDPIFAEVQASVTDDIVARYASTAALLSRASVPDHDIPVNHPAYRFLHAYDGSLRRSSALVLPWKRFEEYEDVARRLAKSNRLRLEMDRSVTDVVQAAEDLASDLGRDATEHVAAYVDQVKATFENPLHFLNYFGYRIGYIKLEELAEYLTSECGVVSNHHGFWECIFLGTKDPLHSMTRTAILEGDDGVEVQLDETSPLVASLENVEKHSVRFYAFFVVTEVSGRQPVERHRLRESLRSRFVDVFSQWAAEELSNQSISLKATLLEIANADRTEV